MPYDFQPGQMFRMTNPDYNSSGEEWTVEELGPETIRFARRIFWVRDIAYVLPESTEPFLGKVLKDYPDGVLIGDARYQRHNEAFHFQGDTVTHCSLSP